MTEVTKTIQDVDTLFSEIVVNGKSHVSERYVASTPQPQNQTQTTPQTEQRAQGEDVYAVELNNVLHDFVDQSVTEALESETTARETADEALDERVGSIESKIPSQASSINKLADTASVSSIASASVSEAIDLLDVGQSGGNGKYIKAISETDGKISATEGTIDSSVTSGSDNPVSSDAVNTAVSAVQASISDIESLIPSQATTSNKLADKNFVNSSIATNTANFLGTYTSMAQIEAIQNPTNKDYVFLETTDQAGNVVFDRYKYNADQSQWLFEYELNNSSFTAEQWATINSGLTSSSISDAIGGLDVPQAGGNGKYIKAISETDGKISATEGTIDSAVTAGSSNPVTSGGVKDFVDNQIATAITQVLNTSF